MATIIFLLGMIATSLGANAWTVWIAVLAGLLVELTKEISRFFSVCKED